MAEPAAPGVIMLKIIALWVHRIGAYQALCITSLCTRLSALRQGVIGQGAYSEGKAKEYSPPPKKNTGYASLQNSK